MPRALIASGLHKTYGRQRVLAAVDLTVGEGELILIQGENGVGKTTLLRILAGREQPDIGEVLVYGKTFAGERTKKLLSLSRPGGSSHPLRSPQSPRMFNSLTVSECFDLMHIKSSAPSRAAFREEEATTAGSLSGGRRKALSVALALDSDCQVVILDEPEAGLDAENISRLAQALSVAKARGQTIVVSGHQPSPQLKDLADELYWIYNCGLHTQPPPSAAKTISTNSGSKLIGVRATTVNCARVNVMDLVVERNGSRVLDRLSFSIEPGQVLSLSGANGSGKSSLALALAGLIASQGIIEVNGCRLDGLSPSDRVLRGVSFMPQAPQGIFLDLTVRENLRAATTRSSSSEFMPVLFKELVELQREPARRLSGGFQRMLSLAMTLRRGTGFVILDEPFAGLGSRATEKVVEVLHWLTGKATVLVLEHKTEVLRAAGFTITELTGLSRGKSA